MRKFFVIAIVCLCITSFGYAQVSSGPISDPSFSVIYAQPETRSVYESGQMESAGSNQWWKAVFTDPATSISNRCSLLFVFKLPDRQGQLVEVNQLMFYFTYLYSDVRITSIDLYGVGFVDAATDTPVTSDMYYQGTWGWDPDAEPLEQGIATTEDVASYTWFETASEGSLRLSCWLNSLYDAGANAGDYVILRLSHESFSTLYNNLQVADSSLDNGDFAPRIYYKLVDSLSQQCPEPVRPERRCEGDTTGDLDGDCRVTFTDIAMMASNWVNCNRIPADMCD